MRHRIRHITIGLLLLAQSPAFGNGFDTLSEIRRVVGSLKQFNSMSYDYTKTAVFPNGDKDSLVGHIQVNNEQKELFNVCNAFTMVYTKNWFFKADHRKKALVILNLSKNYDKKLKKNYEQEVFGNMALDKFFDSVVLKTAKVTELRTDGDRMTLRLAFPKSAITKSLSITFNNKFQMPESYWLETFQVMQHEKGVVKGVSARIKCSGFQKQVKGRGHTIDEFFEVKKGVVKLRQFNDYKLSTKI